MNDYPLDLAARFGSRLRERLPNVAAVAVLETPGVEDDEVRLVLVLRGTDDRTAGHLVAEAALDAIAEFGREADAPRGSIGFGTDSEMYRSLIGFPWDRASEHARKVAGTWRGGALGTATVLYLEDENGQVIRDFPKVATHR